VLDVPPDLGGPLFRMQAGDQVQRHVDTRRDTGGGDDLACVGEARLGADVDVTPQLF
jgi:hypothetical protein